MRRTVNLVSAFDPTSVHKFFDLFHDEDQEILPLPARSVPDIKPVQYNPYNSSRSQFVHHGQRRFFAASENEDLSKTEVHKRPVSFVKLSKKEIDEAANGLFIILSSAFFATCRTFVSNLTFFELAKTVQGSDVGKINNQTLWQKLTLNLGLKLASTGSGYAAKTMALDATRKAELSHNQAAAAVTLACLVAGAGFDIKGIMVKAGKVLGDPSKVTPKMVARAYFATLPLYLARSGLNIFALTDQKATLLEKSIAAGLFTYMTTPLINVAAKTNMNIFNMTVAQAYKHSANSFAEEGFLNVLKKIAKEGFVEEVRAPFRKATTEILAKIIEEIDELIISHTKAAHEEQKAINVDEIASISAMAFQAAPAISIRAAVSTKAASIATKDPRLRAVDSLGMRLSGSIPSTIVALALRDKMTKENKYSESEINIAMTVTNQMMQMLTDIKSQQNNLVKKREIDPNIKVPGMARMFEANVLAGPLFTLRLLWLWQATNKEGISLYQRAAEAGASNFITHPVVSMGIKFGYNYNQTNEHYHNKVEKTWEVFKMGLKEQGWGEVFEAYKNKSFAQFEKEFIKAIKISYAGVIKSSVAAAIASVFLSRECHKFLKELLLGDEAEDVKENQADINKPVFSFIQGEAKKRWYKRMIVR